MRRSNWKAGVKCWAVNSESDFVAPTTQPEPQPHRGRGHIVGQGIQVFRRDPAQGCRHCLRIARRVLERKPRKLACR